jgi:hypothetical protein
MGQLLLWMYRNTHDYRPVRERAWYPCSESRHLAAACIRLSICVKRGDTTGMPACMRERTPVGVCVCVCVCVSLHACTRDVPACVKACVHACALHTFACRPQGTILREHHRWQSYNIGSASWTYAYLSHGGQHDAGKLLRKRAHNGGHLPHALCVCH